MVNPNRFYTYAYLRADRSPYYIGKGKGRRVYKKGRGEVNPPKDKSRIIFLKQNLTEEEAFKHEIYMIAVFGRKDLGTGILRNKTDGGEGPSGAVMSKETRRKISEAQKGKTLSEETRRKLSEANRGKNNPNYGKCGKDNHCYGKSHSEETRRKISEGNKGKTHSQETRRKISEAISGVKNGSAKIWKITFDDGRTIKLNTVKKWAEENGYDISHISRVAYNKRNYHKDIVAVEILTE